MPDNLIPDPLQPSSDAERSSESQSPQASPDRAQLEARYRHALAEVERLARPQDFGSADRTSREAGRAMWLAEAERLKRLLELEDGGASVSRDAGNSGDEA